MEICCTKRQSARTTAQERTYTEDELSDEDEYLCEFTEANHRSLQSTEVYTL